VRTATLFSFLLAVTACRSTPQPRKPVVLKPHDGDHLWVFPESKDHLGSGGELQIYLDAKMHPQAKVSFAKFSLGVDGQLPVHRHDKTEEIAYILSGVGVVISLDDDGKQLEVPISAGYVWYNPPGVWHGLKNTGSVPLSMVFATIPNEKKGLLSFFRRVCVGPGKEGTSLSQEEFERIGSEHDLILRGSTAP